MNNTIQGAVAQRGITRLCHFTASRSLGHIMTDPQGILATKHLQDDSKKVLNPSDPLRLDNHPDHVCCTIEYPNAFFFRTARSRAPTYFPDWAVLFIKPHHLWASGTLFFSINAATAGSKGREGFDGFNGMFAQSVTGKRTRSRTNNQPEFLPTDIQAEVLIPDRIAREDLLGIGVADESQARREIASLKLLNVPIPRIWVSEALFGQKQILEMLNSGNRPDEQEYTGEHNG